MNSTDLKKLNELLIRGKTVILGKEFKGVFFDLNSYYEILSITMYEEDEERNVDSNE